MNIRRLIDRAVRAFYLRHEVERVSLTGFLIGEQLFNHGGLTYKLLRDKYQTTTQADWDKVIKADWTNERKYNLDKYRCTDFAVSFKARMADEFGLNVGIVVTVGDADFPAHAFNCIVVWDGELAPGLSLRWFEPQTDTWVVPVDLHALRSPEVWF